MNQVFHLHPDDNVAVAVADLAEGGDLAIAGATAGV
jgi:hypothetical protein